MTLNSPLVSTHWLRNRLDGPDIVILDASVFLALTDNGTGVFRSGLDAFQQDGHLPRARFADLFTEFSDPSAALPFTRPSKEQFETAAGRLGITPDSHVVIYDNLIGQWAARLWWVFRTFGHRKVSVLDGGLRKYVNDGGELERVLAPHGHANYRVSGETRYLARQQDVADVIAGKRQGTLVCLLQPDDFAGTVSVRARPGHIPGSVNLPFNQLVDEEVNTLLDAERLRSMFAGAVPLDGGLIITYCGGGIASTLGALALAKLGYDNTLEYDGSLAEWSANPALPLEIGFPRDGKPAARAPSAEATTDSLPPAEPFGQPAAEKR